MASVESFCPLPFFAPATRANLSSLLVHDDHVLKSAPRVLRVIMHGIGMEWVNKNIKLGSHNHRIQSPNEMRLQIFIDVKGCRSRHFKIHCRT